jgi:putative NADH-flavin reductase
MVGSRLIAELAGRGHEVTSITRHPEKLQQQAGVTTAGGDVTDETGLAKLIGGHDAVAHSVPFLNTNAQAVIAAVKRSGVPRLLVVGGAGSLEVAPGVALVDTPEFPAQWKPEAEAGRNFLVALRAEPDLNWTYVSPPAFFAPGPRTGKFRLGTDSLLTAADGQSHISAEDFAIAFVDELEAPKHSRRRFTVGY